MRERRKRHRHHHARHAVDGRQSDPAEHELECALVAEKVDEGDRGKQRRRQDRDHRQVAPHTFSRYAAALDRVGKEKRQRHGGERGQRSERQGVARGLRERRRLHVLHEVRQTDELAGAAFNAAHQDHRQWHRQKYEQRAGEQHQTAARRQRLGRQRPARRRARTRRRRCDRVHPAMRAGNTRTRSTRSAISTSQPSRTSRSRN